MQSGIMPIWGWWAAFGITLAVVEMALVHVASHARLRRRSTDTRSARHGYVTIAPDIGGGLSGGRFIMFAAMLPSFALVACACAFASVVSLTIFPKYCNPIDDADLYHALNTPFYVGLGAALVAVMLLLGLFAAARVRRTPTDEERA